ncbi:MAG: YIP1 family protein [Acidobacteria bacterium]|nr:YIP1 family protein [Acidobacteriota bacterium]
MAIPPPPPPGDEPPMVPSTMEEPPQGPPPPEARALPWEETGYPFLEGLFETAKLFVSKPTEAFGRMRRAGDLGRPILYAVIVGWTAIIVSQLYSLAFRGLSWQAWPGMNRFEQGFPIAVTAALMIFAPVFILLGLFIWSGIVHLMLMIIGGAQEGFDATFRVMSYATTAQLAQVVPLCGGLAASIWALVLEIIGIAQAHRISQGKAAVAVLVPLALCCVCIAVVFAISGAAITAAIAGAASHAR